MKLVCLATFLLAVIDGTFSGERVKWKYNSNKTYLFEQFVCYGVVYTIWSPLSSHELN